MIKFYLLFPFLIISFLGFSQHEHKRRMDGKSQSGQKESTAAEDYLERKPGSVHVGRTIEYEFIYK